MADQKVTPSMYHLDSLGCIAFDGPDTIKFLQGQITVNAERISENELSLGAVCNPQGRCIALFWATKIGETILFIQMKETIESTVAHLNKYAVFFKCDIADVSENYAIIGLWPGSELQPESDPEGNIVAALSSPDKKIHMRLLSLNSETPDSPLAQCGTNETWLAWVASQGVPWLTQASQSEFLPHNMNLPELGAVDFKKGCFTGQEVIARMQYKGKLKSHMQKFQCRDYDDSVQPMAKVYSQDKIAGEVICAAMSLDGPVELLALIKDRYLDDKNFRLNHENGPILELTSNI